MWTYVQFIPEIVYLLWTLRILELHRFMHRVLCKHDSSQYPSRSSLCPPSPPSHEVPAFATPPRRRGMHNLNVPRPSFPPFQENRWLLCRGYLPGESRRRALSIHTFPAFTAHSSRTRRATRRPLVEKVFHGYGNTRTRYAAAPATASSTAR